MVFRKLKDVFAVRHPVINFLPESRDSHMLVDNLFEFVNPSETLEKERERERTINCNLKSFKFQGKIPEGCEASAFGDGTVDVLR